MRNKPELGSIILTLLVIGLIVFLGFNVEFYDKKTKSNMSKQALRNPYLAAQQFLHKSGIEISTADNLLKLDSLMAVETLLITDVSHVNNQRKFDQVKKWLEKGGNIIVATDSFSISDEILLKEFNVEVSRPSLDGEDWYDEKSILEQMREYNRQVEQGKSRKELEDVFKKDAAMTNINFGKKIGNLSIEFKKGRVLNHPYIDDEDYDETKPRPTTWSSSDYGVQLMQFDVGNGLLTFVSDSSIWTSYRVGQHDHAFLLWVLSSQSGDFAILKPVLDETLWLLAKTYASELLISVSLLCLIVLWNLGQRFGPIVARDSSSHRALAVHFLSISSYLWQRKRRSYLIAPLRHRVLRRAGASLAKFARAQDAKQMELIAQHCDLNVEVVSQAMTENEFNEKTFVKTVQLLKHIEQSL